MSSASVQNSVAIHPDAGFAGQEFESGGKSITKIAGVTITYGKYVVFNGETCTLGTTATDITGKQGGVALRDPTNAQGQYLPGDPVAVMIEGFVWVPTEEAVAASDKAFVRFAGATTGKVVGYFRNDTDGTTATAANPPGVAWHKGGTTLACLRVNVAGLAGGATGPTS